MVDFQSPIAEIGEEKKKKKKKEEDSNRSCKI